MFVEIIWQRIRGLGGRIKAICRKLKSGRSRNIKRPPLLFLNIPVKDHEKDVIGLDVCAATLSAAIDTGAQMIAITSPFGAGKTSVIELLKEKRRHNKREQIINIPMWTQLKHQNEQNTQESPYRDVTDLHKNMLYQIASHIRPRIGTYITRRLSANYGLLKVHINKRRYWLLGIGALLLFAAGWVGSQYAQAIIDKIPKIAKHLPLISVGLKGLGILLGIVLVAKGEIIFSSKSSEKEREIEADEIMDLYRGEILQPIQHIFSLRVFPCYYHRYIIVIEDLDRCDNGQAVYAFLTELRKYYMPEGSNQSNYRNRVAFIVNIKPESVLRKEKKANDDPALYAKLFDYVLDLRTININDYETILNNLLQNMEYQLSEIDLRSQKRLVDIPGMQWIIRGRNLSIRSIKYRLNKAIMTYLSLRERFHSDDPSFEKCAVMAYLTTEFEEEFAATSDTAFDQLIELKLTGRLSIDNCTGILPDMSKDRAKTAGDPKRPPPYWNTVIELVAARHIDETYRMYFYNYPRNGRYYTASEMCVKNAIEYGTITDQTDEAIKHIAQNKSQVIKESLLRRAQLKLSLPEIACHNEYVFIEALRTIPQIVDDWMSELGYSAEEAPKTIISIVKVLGLDSRREVFCQETINHFREIWEAHAAEKTILQLRKAILKRYAPEILWYKALFFSPHQIISHDEIQGIPMDEALSLTDIRNSNLDISTVESLLDKYTSEEVRSTKTSGKMNSFLGSICSILPSEELAPLLLRYMTYDKTIVPEFETILCEALGEAPTKSPMFSKYQTLINMVGDEPLSEKTMENIYGFNYYDGYADCVVTQLLESGYIIDAVIMSIRNGNAIEYNKAVHNELKSSLDWLKEHTSILLEIRRDTVGNADIVPDYTFLFDEGTPVMTSEELGILKEKLSVEQIQKLIPAASVSRAESAMLCVFWNEKYRTNNVAFAILEYIATLNTDEAKYCFQHLDFETAIRYNNFSEDKKSAVKQKFNSILSLQSVEGKLRFLEMTKCMDMIWNKTICDEINGDPDQEQQYREAANNSRYRSDKEIDNAIRTLCGFTTIGAVSEDIENRMLALEEFDRYIISRVLRLGRFDLETSDRTSKLWVAYVRVFSTPDYGDVRADMAQNHDFLTIMMQNEDYVDMPAESRYEFRHIAQDAACIRDAAQIDSLEQSREQYFCEIAGFTDHEAAKAFIDILGDTDDLLRSEQVYENTYEKLIDPILKRKYTTMRNKSLE